MCLISFFNHLVSLTETAAANNAALLTLNGGFNLLRILKFFEAYPQQF